MQNISKTYMRFRDIIGHETVTIRAIAMYEKRSRRIFQVLKILALNRELYQGQIPELTKTSPRNLIRQLQLLERNGLIQIARKEESSKKGKEKNVWKLTFSGIMVALAETMQKPLNESNKDIDCIAQAQEDKWLIFQEWSYLAEDPEIKDVLLNSLSVFLAENSNVRLLRNFRYLKDWPKLWPNKEVFKDVHALREELLRKMVTTAALDLEMVFEHGAVPPWIYKLGNENAVLVRLWKLSMENEKLRKFLKEQFEYEDCRHRIIKEFQNWLLGVR